MDERFIIHRLHSTRWAAIVGIILMAVLISYEFFARNIFRWDLLIVMCGMGLAKWVAMLYYRKTD